MLGQAVSLAPTFIIEPAHGNHFLWDWKHIVEPQGLVIAPLSTRIKKLSFCWALNDVTGT